MKKFLITVVCLAVVLIGYSVYVLSSRVPFDKSYPNFKPTDNLTSILYKTKDVADRNLMVTVISYGSNNTLKYLNKSIYSDFTKDQIEKVGEDAFSTRFASYARTFYANNYLVCLININPRNSYKNQLKYFYHELGHCYYSSPTQVSRAYKLIKEGFKDIGITPDESLVKAYHGRLQEIVAMFYDSVNMYNDGFISSPQVQTEFLQRNNRSHNYKLSKNEINNLYHGRYNTVLELYDATKITEYFKTDKSMVALVKNRKKLNVIEESDRFISSDFFRKMIFAEIKEREVVN